MTSRPPIDIVTLGDVSVAYRRSGAGQRVVMIHGLGQDHRIWEDLQRQLDDFETVAYDIRGHGSSTLGDANGTIAQLGRDLLSLLEEIGPAVCIGFSLGGTIALWAAAQRPVLVPAVIAIATSSVVGRVAAASMDDRISQVLAGDRNVLRAIIEQDTLSQLAGFEVDVEYLVESRMEAIGEADGYLNGARAVRAMRDEPLNGRLDAITQPVLIVSGSIDSWCPRKAADIMLEHLSNASFEELDGVGHLVTDIAPGALLAVVRPWLLKLETS